MQAPCGSVCHGVGGWDERVGVAVAREAVAYRAKSQLLTNNTLLALQMYWSRTCGGVEGAPDVGMGVAQGMEKVEVGVIVHLLHKVVTARSRPHEKAGVGIQPSAATAKQGGWGVGRGR